MPRRYGKADASQAGIIRACEAAGAGVVDLKGVGGGCPDLLLMCRGQMQLVEVKSSEAEAKRKGGKTAQRQQEFAAWAAHFGCPVAKIWTIEQALDIVASMKGLQDE